MKCVYLRTTWSLTLLNVVSKHDLLHLKEDVFGRSTYRLSVMIKAWKHDFLQSNEIRVLAFDIQLICFKYGLQSWRANSRNSSICARPTVYLYWIWSRNMIREKWWNKLHMYPIAPQCVFLTRVAPTENIRVIALVVHPNCAAYVLEKWLALKWWNTFIGAKHLVSFISITLLRRLGRNHSPVRKFFLARVEFSYHYQNT
jgi:hypothetical protein